MKKYLLIIIWLFWFASFCELNAQNNIDDKSTYLLVLDVQQGYLDNIKFNEDIDKYLEALNKVIDETDPAKVIYIGSIHRALVINGKGISIDTLYSIKPDERVHRVNNIIISKDQGDAFTSDSLVSYLKSNNAESIIVTGLLAEKCVKHTVLGGLEMGYQMYIIPEAIISKNHRKMKKTLKFFDETQVNIIDLEEYCR